MILSFVVGFLGALWLATVVSVGYVLWRYAYLPFLVMRKDIKALLDKHEQDMLWVKNEIGLRKAMTLNDQDVAIVEERLRAKRILANRA